MNNVEERPEEEEPNGLWSLVDGRNHDQECRPCGINHIRIPEIRIRNMYEALQSDMTDEEWAETEATAKCSVEKPKKMTRWHQPSRKKQKVAKTGAERQEHADSISWEELMMCLGDGSEDPPSDCIMTCKDEDEGFVWVKEEAAVDSGAVDCVASKKRFSHLKIQPTPESERGDCWTCAGGKQIRKEGEITLDFVTNEGHAHKVKVKIGEVSRTLISADKLLDKGSDVVLSKVNPRIVTRKGQTIKLRRRGGMFLLDMRYKVPKSKAADAFFPRRGS